MTALPASGGGIRLWNAYERVTSDGLNDSQTMGLQFVLDALLGSMTYNHEAPAPRDGFLGRSFEPSYSGSNAYIAPGLALRYDSTLTDDHAPHIIPLFSDDQVTQAATNNASGLSRIDIISIGVNEVDDESATVYIKDPATGQVTGQTKDTRRQYRHTLTYTLGTPHASPVPPATPAGHLLVCQFTVVTGGSAISDMIDHRAQLPLPTDKLPMFISHAEFHCLNGAAIADEARTGTTTLGTLKVNPNEHDYVCALKGIGGLRIDKMEIWVNMGATDDSITLELREIDPVTPANLQIATVSKTGVTGDSFAVVDVDYAPDERDRTYLLWLKLTPGALGGADPQFYGARFL